MARAPIVEHPLDLSQIALGKCTLRQHLADCVLPAGIAEAARFRAETDQRIEDPAGEEIIVSDWLQHRGELRPQHRQFALGRVCRSAGLMDLGQMPLERQRRRIAFAKGRAGENRVEREVGQALHVHGEGRVLFRSDAYWAKAWSSAHETYAWRGLLPQAGLPMTRTARN